MRDIALGNGPTLAGQNRCHGNCATGQSHELNLVTLAGCLALRSLGYEPEAAGVPFPQRSRPHQNPRVTIACFQQLFSPIGDFNCQCGAHLRLSTLRSNPDSRSAEIFFGFASMRRTGPAPLTKNFSAPTPLILQLFSPIGDFNCRKSHRADEKNGAPAFFVKHL